MKTVGEKTLTVVTQLTWEQLQTAQHPRNSLKEKESFKYESPGLAEQQAATGGGGAGPSFQGGLGSTRDRFCQVRTGKESGPGLGRMEAAHGRLLRPCGALILR